MATPYLQQWLMAFVMTQVIEIPLYVFALRRRAQREDVAPDHSARGWTRLVLLAFVASAVTHPLVWFAFPSLLMHHGYGTYMLVAEGFVIVAEASYLWALGVRRALLWSAGANALSAGLGLLRVALDMA